MEEIVMIDGIQYKLSYDQPITAEQRLQTIEEIRRSLGHNTYEKAAKTVKGSQTNNIGQLSSGMSVS